MNKEYHRKYNQQRYQNRMQKARNVLGGVCVICGCSENLEIDHINPDNLSFRIAEGWDRKWSEIEYELSKCQLLCKFHHNDKTLEQTDRKRADHGSLAYYTHHKCRCALCKKTNAEYTRKYRQRHKRK